MPPETDRSEDAARVAVIADDLLAVAVDDAITAQALAVELRRSGAWCEVVAGLDSVVVQFDNLALDVAAAAKRLAAMTSTIPSADALPDALIELPVCYGGACGPDLDDVCARLGLEHSEFVARHTAREHRVEMLGFTPGFAYVGGLDPSLDVPRRREPRQHVPAGSVGIAGRQTGLYALPGPGGWCIVGRTPQRLFDPHAEQPFRLGAGVRIRFRAIDAAEFERLQSA